MNPWLYVAQQRKKERLQKMAAGILEYCRRQDNCGTCVFYDEDPDWSDHGCCRVYGEPPKWDLEEAK